VNIGTYEIVLIDLGIFLGVFYYINKIINYINKKIEINEIREQEKLREQRRREEFIEKEALKKQEELKRREEIKKQEELRSQEQQNFLDELKRIEEQKNLEELKIIEEQKRQNELIRKLYSNQLELSEEEVYKIREELINISKLQAERRKQELLKKEEEQKKRWAVEEDWWTQHQYLSDRLAKYENEKENKFNKNDMEYQEYKRSFDRKYQSRCTGICSECRRECIEDMSKKQLK
jgi:hypothetical protein